jgi:hypothetical protein
MQTKTETPKYDPIVSGHIKQRKNVHPKKKRKNWIKLNLIPKKYISSFISYLK